jgi:hypothetical protein
LLWCSGYASPNVFNPLVPSDATFPGYRCLPPFWREADRQKLYKAQLAKLKPFVVRRKTRNYGVSIRHTQQVAPAEHANKEKESSKSLIQN